VDASQPTVAQPALDPSLVDAGRPQLRARDPAVLALRDLGSYGEKPSHIEG
jgi:hypothetical protein